MYKNLFFLLSVLAGTASYATSPEPTTTQPTINKTKFEVPETQFETLQLMDELEETIESSKNDIEELESFRLKIESATNYMSAFNDFSMLNKLVADLKTAIEETNKRNFRSTEINSQYKLEMRLLSEVDALIPEELRYRLDWLQSIQSREVVSEVQSFIQIINEIINRISKRDQRFSMYYGTLAVTKESLIFQTVTDLEAYMDIVVTAFKTEIPTQLNSCIKSIDDKIKSKEIKIKDAKYKLSEIYNKENDKFDINVLAIWVGLPAFCLTILLLYLIPEWLSRNNPDKKINYSSLLQLITVFLLTMTILILGLSGLLTPEVLGTLIGGISGYVLNRTVSSNRATS